MLYPTCHCTGVRVQSYVSCDPTGIVFQTSDPTCQNAGVSVYFPVTRQDSIGADVSAYVL